MKYKSFSEFYPYYLSQHENINCRRLHVVGTILGLFFLLLFIFTLNFSNLIFAVLLGYGLAWLGHYLYEKNQPLTFKYPLYSLLGDLMLVKEVLTGKIKLF